MGQKINPIAFRLGVIRGWESNWYGGKNFSEKLIEDEKIRKYLRTRIQKGGISKIVIERTIKRIIITIHTSRPGIVIGKAGSEVDKIKEEIKKLTNKDIAINIFEIKRPELDAVLVGESIANQIEARVSYKRATKAAISNSMKMGAEGIKVMISGRLNGAEMARSETYKEGRTPLHTIRADIDYTIAEALTVYGKIGIKVWICRGEVYGKRDLSPNFGMTSDNKPGDRGGRPSSRPSGDRRNDRGDRGGDRKRGGGNTGGGDRRRK
jgi:small subunit ribosomal protein S3